MAALEHIPAPSWYFRNQPVLRFLFRLGFLIGIFFLIKTLHNLSIDPDSFLYHPAIESLDLYKRMSDSISYPTQFLLSLIGEEANISGRVISFNGFRGVEIQGPCMGLNIFAIFTALILSYPSTRSLKTKLTFIIIGLLLLHFTNILRVSGLLMKNKYYPDINFNHHDVYNFIIYGFVILLFYYWITKINRSGLIMKESKI